jgi:pyrroloquinoline-quinone synthase
MNEICTKKKRAIVPRQKNHVVLMEDFLRAIGTPDEENDSAAALKPTQELINYRMGACLDKERYPIGAAAVLVASEGQNLEPEARHTLFGKAYNLKEEDLLFFSVHQKEDAGHGHVRQGMDLPADLCSTEKMQQEVLEEAINTTCKLFYGLYQGIYDHLGLGQAQLAEA